MNKSERGGEDTDEDQWLSVIGFRQQSEKHDEEEDDGEAEEEEEEA